MLTLRRVSVFLLYSLGAYVCAILALWIYSGGGFLQVELDELCDHQCCVAVMDKVDLWRARVHRILYFPSQQNNNAVQTELPIIPSGYSDSKDLSSFFGTTDWHVDRSQLYGPLPVAAVLLGFATGALKETKTEGRTQKVLIAGLGGGALDMWLHTKYPQIDITVVEQCESVVQMANEWFDVAEDSTRRTLVADGILAIRKAASKGLKFDLVVIDASQSDAKWLLSPPAEFLAAKTLHNIKTMLTLSGLCIFNVLEESREEKAEILDWVESRLRSILPHCIKLHSKLAGVNAIFGCLASDENLHAISDRWMERFESLAKRFGFSDQVKEAEWKYELF